MTQRLTHLVWTGLAGALLSAAPLSTSCAGELVYEPVNPSFGGNPFNSAHLQGLAASQNLYKSDGSSETSPLDDFGRRIQSALLSRVASEIANQILGDNPAASGTFVVDGTTINFTRDGSTVTVDIVDGATGGSTQIKIPIPGG